MFYRVARPGLEHQLGPPTFDGATLNPGRRYDSFEYALRWDGLRTTINLKVVGNFDDRNTRKRLQIWYRPTR